ncbi:helix-turn-helix domain-containing protein [Streptomyces sp. NPDC058142]|uniref:helix-turn-helix domain-containing protein n=1 Tax=Streptomyces sp. NPDC058142 TaxID=3346355 RepID=UPI0036F04C19
MVLLRLSPMALSQSRFALSPSAETLGSMSVLMKPCSDPWLTPWYTRHHDAFHAALDADPFARGLVELICSTKYLPGYVSRPPSGGMRTTLADELKAVATARDDAIRADLDAAVARSWKRHDLEWLTGHGWGPRTAELFRQVWTTHVSPDWPRRRALLERDVTYRAGLLAAYGWPRALQHMNRRSAWVGADAIRFSDQPGPDCVVGEGGMLFVPVCVTSGTWLAEAPPDRYALVYPARGTAERTGRARAPQALDRLIGSGRAALLHELARPATSSELAAHLGQSLGTVGGHLAVLRDADMVVGTRVGRRVVYRRTEAGDRLAGRASSADD